MLVKLKNTFAKTWLIIALVALLIIFHPLLGQENKQINNSELLTQNDLNTESKEEDDDDDYWTRHFNARYGVSYSHGLDRRSHRRYYYASLSWKHDFDWVNFNIEGLASRRDFSYSLEFITTTNEGIEVLAKRIQMRDANIRHIETQMKPDPRTVEDICASPPIVTSENLLKATRFLEGACDEYYELSDPNASSDTKNINELDFTLRVLDNQISWQEAYAKFNIGESLQVLVGWHTVIWGQLDFLSPVDIILPQQIGASTGLGLTKSDNRKPQKSLILYYFPVPYIEIQAYLFPELALDSTLLTLIEAKYTNNQDDILSILGYKDAYAIELPEGKDKYRYAARVLFYLEQFTLGLTYYKAYYPYTIDENIILSERNRNDPEKTKFYHLEIRPEFQSWENFGIELAYPIDKWVWKLELLYTNLQDNLREVETMNYSSQLAEFIEKDDSFDLQTTYYNFLLEQKNGELSISEELYIGGFGADAQYGPWLFNLGVLFAYLRRSDIDQRALELSREVNEEELGYLDQDFIIAPVINVAHYLDQDKTETVGVAFGFLPIGSGIVLYTTREYFESLQLALSLEYFAFNNSDLIKQEGYRLKNAAYPSLRFIFDYKL